ncbi:MAG: hypothetical protein M0P31_00935 [Solirubrobacteraceae bacterium]|nr:hypothetical protein [Solirubrobacteraceae bacterium]
MTTRPFRPRWHLAVLGTAALALSGATSATAAQPAEPDSPQRSSISHKNWQFTLHAAEGGGGPIGIAVRHEQGGLETVLRPDRDLDCPEAGGIAGGCQSVVDYPRHDSLRGKGMIVHAETPDEFHPPEVVAVLNTGGASGSFSAIGYHRGQDGPWRHSTLDSGSTAIITDGKGRIRVGDPRWESLDWSRAARYPYQSWYTYSPTKGERGGWERASRKSDHRKELRSATRKLSRLKKSKGRQAREGQRAVRGVIAAHRKALGQKKSLRNARKSYRRMYGSASLKRLDRGLRRVKRVGS